MLFGPCHCVCGAQIWSQLNCASVGGLKKNFDNIKMHGVYVEKKFDKYIL
jgi:hypothetical protein